MSQGVIASLAVAGAVLFFAGYAIGWRNGRSFTGSMNEAYRREARSRRGRRRRAAGQEFPIMGKRPSTSTRHRWPDSHRVELGRFKTEYTCPRCGMVMASLHQYPSGQQEIHWKEFYLDGERVDAGDGRTPPCDARLEAIP